MRQLIKNFILVILLSLSLSSVNAELSGNIDYSIPIDYTKLNAAELEENAKIYYSKAIVTKKLNDDMTTALNLYTMLSNTVPDNPEYALKLGKLYDVLGKDRLAKGNYYRAMGINQSNPEPYCYLGDFFYDREQYRKAFKYYKKAYDNGYSLHSHTLCRIDELQKKLCDTKKLFNFSDTPDDVPKEIITDEI